jgi:shikimate dehydrogenase
MEIRGTTTMVGLLGWPTSHSLSPPMQNAGFAALGLDWAYVPLPTPPELLGDAVRGLRAMGFAGANVTIPHKQDVVPLCDELDEIARRAGSVNTLVFAEGRILGSSTDGDAVTSQIEAEGRRALVLGAGGCPTGRRAPRRSTCS